MIKGDNGVTEMTAKSEMRCNRLLRLSGERGTDSYKTRLFVAKLSGADPRKIIHPFIYWKSHTNLTHPVKVF